jgi:2-dehydropantoate 2-reductase
MFLAAVAEVAASRRHGITPEPIIASGRIYVGALPPSTRSSLLIDLAQGKRIEVEALQGSVVRRGSEWRADARDGRALRRAETARGGFVASA